jgi:hypothetical protein
MLVHGDADTGYRYSRQTYPELASPKWFVTLRGGRHGPPFEDAPDEFDRFVRRLTSAFWDRYLGRRGHGRQPHRCPRRPEPWQSTLAAGPRLTGDGLNGGTSAHGPIVVASLPPNVLVAYDHTNVPLWGTDRMAPTSARSTVTSTRQPVVAGRTSRPSNHSLAVVTFSEPMTTHAATWASVNGGSSRCSARLRHHSSGTPDSQLGFDLCSVYPRDRARLHANPTLESPSRRRPRPVRQRGTRRPRLLLPWRLVQGMARRPGRHLVLSPS